MNRNQTVAIIGAGVGGLTCARQLATAGFRVQVFDKARGVGGRISVRRNDLGCAFDHGAQYFTVRESAMIQQVDEWIDAGVVAPWDGRIVSLRSGEWNETSSETKRYVGVPGMNAIAKHLAVDLDIALQAKVTTVTRTEAGWRLMTEDNQEMWPVDYLVVNTPAPQATELLHEYPQIVEEIRPAKIAPCWAVMLAFAERLDVPWDGAFIEDSALSWAARNSSKPGRSAMPDCWVLHASPDWSTEHLEESQDWVTSELLNSFWQTTGVNPRPHIFAAPHRWRLALPTEPLEHPFLFDEELRLGACGDWCGGPRVEGAFLSGLALADRLSR